MATNDHTKRDAHHEDEDKTVTEDYRTMFDLVNENKLRIAGIADVNRLKAEAALTAVTL